MSKLPVEHGISVLVVEDDQRMRRILTRHLARLGYRVDGASTGGEALASIGDTPPDVILSDIQMPGIDGRTLLGMAQERFPSTKVILMTAFGSVDDAVEAMSAGAYSYVCKPFKVDEIAAVLRNVSREVSLQRQVGELRKAVRGRYGVERLIGRSPEMCEVRRLVEEAAALSSTVLVSGRSGSGKEMVARAIHYHGPRAAGPFVAVNCAAIPDTLFESEVFGHVRGAFTGADRAHRGLIEQSHGGTLFLDEVAEMPRGQQAKFLRVLEERELRPLGGQQSIPVDLRLICATNRDLSQSVEKGEFREDLYYRLAVLSISMPDLAERPEDIAAIAEHLLLEFAAENGIPGAGFTEPALNALRNRPWRGNVRELRNTIERAAIRARGRRVDVGDVGAVPTQGSQDRAPGEAPGSAGAIAPLVEVEKEHISRALDACGWNRSAAARALGIDRRTLFAKIQRFGLVGPLRPHP